MMSMRERGARGEDGAALELSLIFFAAVAQIVGGLLSFASGSSQASVVTRTVRDTDYDADAAMQAAIATVRIDETQGKLSKCSPYTPTFTLNSPSRLIRVDCVGLTTVPQQRHAIFTVCLASIPAPCQEGQSLLRADVTFYDDSGTIGRALSISSWSNS
jgi:hypothetical protein